jgi:Tfp pilus assembly protein PilF
MPGTLSAGISLCWVVISGKSVEQSPSTQIWYIGCSLQESNVDGGGCLQVYNALGFSYFSDDKLDAGIAQYEKAVKLQPGYVTAWNNLADAYEKKKDFQRALKAYEEALQFDPSNKVANSRRSIVKERVERYEGIPSKLE